MSNTRSDDGTVLVGLDGEAAMAYIRGAEFMHHLLTAIAAKTPVFISHEEIGEAMLKRAHITDAEGGVWVRAVSGDQEGTTGA